jgi:hypothetical protein
MTVYKPREEVSEETNTLTSDFSSASRTRRKKISVA